MKITKKNIATLGRHVLLMAAMGILTSTALPPLHFLPMLLLTFGYVGNYLNEARSFWCIMGSGWIFGFFFYASNLYWLIHAVLFRADDYWWFVPFPSIGCALILSPLIALAFGGTVFFRRGFPRLIAFSALWTLCDMARLFIFSGFTWNALGSAIALPGKAGTVMIQPAAWIGEDGLTLILVFISTIFGTISYQQLRAKISRQPSALLIRHPLQWKLLWCALACFLAFWIISGYVRLKTKEPLPYTNPIVVLVQGNIPQSEKEDNDDPFFILHRYKMLTTQGVEDAAKLKERNAGLKARPIVFIWPETAYPATDLYFQEAPHIRQAIMHWGDSALYGFIGALRSNERGELFNSLFIIDKKGTIRAAYDKARLVPFGEYQPQHIPIQLSKIASITAGPGPKTFHLPDLTAVAPLICYEMIFSGHVIDQGDRPSWLANVTNDAWFGNSAGPRQHLASVRLRGVEEGLPVVRAANTGISIAYDGFGQILSSIPWGKTATAIVPLPAPLYPTFFSKYGQSIPIILSLFTIAASLGIGIIQRKNGKE